MYGTIFPTISVIAVVEMWRNLTHFVNISLFELSNSEFSQVGDVNRNEHHQTIFMEFPEMTENFLFPPPPLI